MAMAFSISLFPLLCAAAAATTLSCSSNSTCPGDVISCECRGDGGLTWLANPPSNPLMMPPLFGESYTTNAASVNLIGVVRVSAGYSVVLLGIDFSTQTVTAQLNITLAQEAMTVTCLGMTTSDSTTLQPATDPSSPLNLSYAQTNSAGDNFTVRLEWEAPLDDGGAAIASYQVSVDMSLAAVVSTDTTTILTLDSTGKYDVEIIAINNCNRTSEPVSINIDVTVSPTTESTTSIQDPGSTAGGDTTFATTNMVSTTATSTLLTSSSSPPLSSPSVPPGNSQSLYIGVGCSAGAIVILVIAICGISILIFKKKSSEPKQVNGEEEIAGYSRFNHNLQPPVAYHHTNDDHPVVLGTGNDEYSVINRQGVGVRPQVAAPTSSRNGATVITPPAIGSEYSVLEQKSPPIISDYSVPEQLKSPPVIRNPELKRPLPATSKQRKPVVDTGEYSTPEHLTTIRTPEKRPPPVNRAQKPAPVLAEYSVLEQKNGAEPEVLPEYDYCRVSSKPAKQVQNRSLVYTEVAASSQGRGFKPAKQPVKYSMVQVTAGKHNNTQQQGGSSSNSASVATEAYDDVVCTSKTHAQPEQPEEALYDDVATTITTTTTHSNSDAPPPIPPQNF